MIMMRRSGENRAASPSPGAPIEAPVSSGFALLTADKQGLIPRNGQDNHQDMEAGAKHGGQ